jgi:hypothetical protein
MSIKKKAKSKAKAAKATAAEKGAGEKKKGKDLAEVRENINELVKDSAEDIATSVIGVAMRTGQLASAKYLFEAVGLYPATEQMEPTPPVKGSLAHTLLTRMGLSTEPVVCDDDEAPVGLVNEVKALTTTNCAPKVADDRVERAGDAGHEVVSPDVVE